MPVRMATDSTIAIFLRPYPSTLLGPLSASPDAKCNEHRYVKANPADRLAGRSHFSQNYTTDTYRYRASGVGGPYSPVVDALANATSTRHPSRGWVNTVSAGVPSETLLLETHRMPRDAC